MSPLSARAKSSFELLGCLLSIGILVIAFTLYLHHRDVVGPPPISTERALALLNACDTFTHTSVGTRQATEVTRITSMRSTRGRDSFATITWRWTSGASAPDLPDVRGRALFEWQTKGHWITDYIYTQDHWRRATLFYGNYTVDCPAPSR